MAGQSVTVEREVMADPQVVWRVVTDLDRSHHILSAVERVERIEGTGFDAGVRWRETRRFLGRDDTQEMYVIEAQAPHRAVIGSESDGITYRTVIEVKPNWMGTTLVFTFAAEAIAASMGKKLMMATVGKTGMKSAKAALTQDLEDIARYAEKAAKR